MGESLLARRPADRCIYTGNSRAAPPSNWDGFLQGLSESGYVEGQTSPLNGAMRKARRSSFLRQGTATYPGPSLKNPPMNLVGQGFDRNSKFLRQPRESSVLLEEL